MSTCHCDGPPHTYDPSWCRQGKDDRGREIRPELKPAPTPDWPTNGRC